MEHSAFPSDETLAAFIDGRLDDETRKRVVAHVADCEDCYGTVMAAGAWQHENDVGVKAGTFARRRGRYVIGLAAAATIGGVLLYQPLSVRYRENRDIEQLRAAANEMPFRVTDARLSLDLSFKEKAPTLRGSEPNSKNNQDSDKLLLSAAATHVQEDARAKLVHQHTLGIALLLTGRRDEAAEILAKAVIEETGTDSVAAGISRCTDVQLLNDLSAAQGAVADFEPSEASRQLAFNAATRAWHLDPKSPITTWNRAVAIERVSPREAPAAWREYLAIDATSPWSAAAKSRLNRRRESS